MLGWSLIVLQSLQGHLYLYFCLNFFFKLNKVFEISVSQCLCEQPLYTKKQVSNLLGKYELNKTLFEWYIIQDTPGSGSTLPSSPTRGSKLQQLEYLTTSCRLLTISNDRNKSPKYSKGNTEQHCYGAHPKRKDSALCVMRLRFTLSLIALPA